MDCKTTGEEVGRPVRRLLWLYRWEIIMVCAEDRKRKELVMS